MPSMKFVSVCLALAASASLPAAARVVTRGPQDQAPLHAASLLQPKELKGPHFTVDDPVGTDGFFHIFTLTSDYGTFTAVGMSEVTTRIDDIRAIAALEDVSKSKVFLESAGGAVVDIGKSTAKAITDPKATAEGIGAGFKRFGVNLGRASKRAATTEGGADTGQSGGETAADTVLGVSSAMRRWAEKVGADPYTTNVILRDALKSIAKVDAAGSIATKVVVPIPQLVGTAATVSGLVWSKDPEELRKINESRVKALGVSDGAAGAFFKNGWYTLTLQTRLVAALDAVRKPGCAQYLQTASQAPSERAALFYVESAEMLQRLHAQSPVDRILPDSRPVVGAVQGKAILLAPVDTLPPTADLKAQLGELTNRARRELKATGLELRMTGRLPPATGEELRRLGWTIQESVPLR